MPKLPPGLVRKRGRPGYYVRDQRGGRDRLVKLSNDRTVAIAKLRELRGELPAEVNVKDATEAWMRGAVATRRNARFQKLTRQRAVKYLYPAFGYRRLASFTVEHCREYRLRLEAFELSPQSVSHLLADLRCMLLWAVETGLLDRSPFPRRLLPKIQERPPDRLSDHDAAALASLPDPLGFVLRLLLGTGLRWGEAQRAEAQHIERDQLVVALTKSGRVRRVPLSPALLAEIRGRVGRLAHVRNAQTIAKAVRAAFPEMRFHVHQTRHTFACRFLEAGGSLPALQEILGHASIVTTQRYGRMSEGAVRREAERGWAHG